MTCPHCHMEMYRVSTILPEEQWNKRPSTQSRAKIQTTKHNEPKSIYCLMTLGCSGSFLTIKHLLVGGHCAIMLQLQTPNWKGLFTCELSTDETEVPLWDDQTAGCKKHWGHGVHAWIKNKLPFAATFFGIDSPKANEPSLSPSLSLYTKYNTHHFPVEFDPFIFI